MPYNRITAKALLSAAELELFDAGRREALGALSSAQLRAKIARARRLRDKYRDLYRRQRLSARARTGTKAGAGGAANFRTAQKAQLFGELLGRFEVRLAERHAGERLAQLQAAKRARRFARTVKRAGAGPAATVQPAGAKRRTGFVSPAAKSADTRRQPVQTGRVAVHAHISSRGRRNQAKRDRRS